MKPYFADDWLTVYQGDCREVMALMEPASVHCVVTSPPYWGLRDYGTASWIGGEADCDHRGPAKASVKSTLKNDGRPAERVGQNDYERDATVPFVGRCGKCGAQREDNQLGLEPTPEEYVANMVGVFREVRRVLRDDGTVWLNLGDSYAGSWGAQSRGNFPSDKSTLTTNNGRGPKAGDKYSALSAQQIEAAPKRTQTGTIRSEGIKPKDLVGIPWRVAFALQQPYYTGRIAQERDRVWMAAMIDGEGTICGFRHERPSANVRTGMLVFITNSDTRVLDEADRIWPGARYIDHNRVGDDMGHGIIANRDSWRWQIQKADERSAFVRELYPYLISKRQQALVAWNLLEFTKAALRMGRGGETAEVKAKRDVLVGILSDLNHYRPVVLPSWLKEPPPMTEPGWYLRSDIIWSKNNPMPESVTDRPTKSHEYLFLLTKSARYYFDGPSVREDDAGTDHPRSVLDGQPSLEPSGGILGAHKGIRTLEGRNGAGRNIRSVWTIATQPYPGAHFATFPPKLVEPCVKAGCPQQGIVLDPFGGSGTTGMVAQHFGRRAVLIDLNGDYLVQAMRRNQQSPLGLDVA